MSCRLLRRRPTTCSTTDCRRIQHLVRRPVSYTSLSSMGIKNLLVSSPPFFGPAIERTIFPHTTVDMLVGARIEAGVRRRPSPFGASGHRQKGRPPGPEHHAECGVQFGQFAAVSSGPPRTLQEANKHPSMYRPVSALTHPRIDETTPIPAPSWRRESSFRLSSQT